MPSQSTAFLIINSTLKLRRSFMALKFYEFVIDLVYLGPIIFAPLDFLILPCRVLEPVFLEYII
ncbi:MAG: hypothetical protein DRO62_01840 [Candidatus Altiarchaeales archaeon]|nr:MAG: hypothetical protein DRO62_01840 [Candidatus Altiarchaeales archaeon]